VLLGIGGVQRGQRREQQGGEGTEITDNDMPAEFDICPLLHVASIEPFTLQDSQSAPERFPVAFAPGSWLLAGGRRSDAGGVGLLRQARLPLAGKAAEAGHDLGMLPGHVP
jgi:hypothetical protein